MNVEMSEGKEQEARVATFGHPVCSSPFHSLCSFHVLPHRRTEERSEVRFVENGLSFQKQLYMCDSATTAVERTDLVRAWSSKLRSLNS
jgi:hypothetical protein